MKITKQLPINKTSANVVVEWNNIKTHYHLISRSGTNEIVYLKWYDNPDSPA